ncbi:MAG: phage tail protein I [Lachnospiraceae bacterium]|nr:phage tail protein I [Lachnospiraceae bacterium]
MAERKYRIKKNRWETALLQGFDIHEDGITTHMNEDGTFAGPYYAFLKPIDSGIPDAFWGRLSLRMEHDSNAAGYVYVFATDEEVLDYTDAESGIWKYLSDPEIGGRSKLKVLMDLGGEKQVNFEDILLYSQKGRYLYIAFEVVGEGTVSITDGCVYSVGDAFMNTFPEVYREEGSFFHRWMSVYSTIYNDMEEEIDALPGLLDPDTCPAEMLPIYASWLGMDISGGFLPEEVCRNLVKEGYELSKRKGTRWALTRIIQIVLGHEAEVLEHNTMRGYLLSDGAELPPNLKEGGVYDVTILVHGEIKELLKHRLMFLLEQFKPVRARLHLVELSQNATMDGNAYLDMNAAIPVGKAPTLDGDSSMGGVLTLN